jgi:hypothetical protein
MVRSSCIEKSRLKFKEVPTTDAGCPESMRQGRAVPMPAGRWNDGTAFSPARSSSINIDYHRNLMVFSLRFIERSTVLHRNILEVDNMKKQWDCSSRLPLCCSLRSVRATFYPWTRRRCSPSEVRFQVDFVPSARRTTGHHQRRNYPNCSARQVPDGGAAGRRFVRNRVDSQTCAATTTIRSASRLPGTDRVDWTVFLPRQAKAKNVIVLIADGLSVGIGRTSDLKGQCGGDLARGAEYGQMERLAVGHQFRRCDHSRFG